MSLANILLRKACNSHLPISKRARPLIQYFQALSNFSGSSTSALHHGNGKGLAVCSIQPTGVLHLGNYFGAVKQCISLQNAGEDVLICISDIQALQSIHDRKVLQNNILVTAATLIACGVDPDKTILFQQSSVPQHAQLDWIFHCLVDINEPDRVQRHAKKLQAIKEPKLGQYVSPVLQATDVLLFKSNTIPSGEDFADQYQMICRTASMFNKKYGQCFLVPQLSMGDFSSRIRSFRQPDEKMSRSAADPRSRIEMLDTPETVTEKCKKAVTDFTSEVYFDAVGRPGVSNLMALHSLVTKKDYETIKTECIGLETAKYKFIVADAINEFLKPIRARVNKILQDKSSLVTELKTGSCRAQLIAERTMKEIHHKIGLQPSEIDQILNVAKTNAPIGRVRGSQIQSVDLKINNSSTDSSRKHKFIFSGIQPTGVLHLGNYFGAVKQWVDLQNGGDDVIVCVVDQHAITVPQKRESLHDNILLMAASIIACGVDPERCILFQQSKVPQHAQLNSIIRNVAHVAFLSRQAQYKDKVTSLEKAPSLGLFSYPVLQAADILLYQATHVPVGDDQRQHIQVAVQIARQFNKRYGEKIFRIPTAMILDSSLARVKSLYQPLKKMSKSEANKDSRIEILDSPESIVNKCKNSSTGNFSGNIRYDLADQPGVSNLMTIHSIISGSSFESIEAECSTLDISDYKLRVADAIIEHLKPIRTTAVQLLSDKATLHIILEKGASLATARAQQTLQTVHEKVGFWL
uniref:tryptophan--tRNA ligase n=1 Tax=Hirondellea gigas TaxID=1518452 RepID=A0A6A7FTS6_9CRUS